MQLHSKIQHILIRQDYSRISASLVVQSEHVISLSVACAGQNHVFRRQSGDLRMLLAPPFHRWPDSIATLTSLYDFTNFSRSVDGVHCIEMTMSQLLLPLVPVIEHSLRDASQILLNPHHVDYLASAIHHRDSSQG